MSLTTTYLARFVSRDSIPLKCLPIALRCISTKNLHGKTKVLLIGGATAVGKTSVSLDLARYSDAEIISADSVQAYRGLSIGSDKVSRETQAQVPHHGLDTADVNREWPMDAGSWVIAANASIDEIAGRGRLPIIVGGSWFYISMLIEGLSGCPSTSQADADLVNQQMEDRGNFQANHAYLMKIDPVYAREISYGDWKRMQRSLVIYNKAKRPVSSFVPKYKLEECPYDFRGVFLYRPKLSYQEALYDRCDQIVYAGLVEETYWAVMNGLDPDGLVAKSIGYHQAIHYLRDNWFADDRPTGRREQIAKFRDLLEDYKKACRTLVNRQMRSWANNSKHFEWLDISQMSDDATVRTILQRYESPTYNPVIGKPKDWTEEGEPYPTDESNIFGYDSAVEKKLDEIQAYLDRDPGALPHPLDLR